MCYDSGTRQVRDFVCLKCTNIILHNYITLRSSIRNTWRKKQGLQNKSCGPCPGLLVHRGLHNQNKQTNEADSDVSHGAELTKHDPRGANHNEQHVTSRQSDALAHPRDGYTKQTMHVKPTGQHSKYFRKPPLQNRSEMMECSRRTIRSRRYLIWLR